MMFLLLETEKKMYITCDDEIGSIDIKTMHYYFLQKISKTQMN